MKKTVIFFLAGLVLTFIFSLLFIKLDLLSHKLEQVATPNNPPVATPVQKQEVRQVAGKVEPSPQVATPSAPPEPRPSLPAPPARPPTSPYMDENQGWFSIWSSDIHASISHKTCVEGSLKAEGYVYEIYASIPVKRLRNRNDAWVVKNDRALTVRGCWYEISDKFIHIKMFRKKDRKITEQDILLDDSWIEMDVSDMH